MSVLSAASLKERIFDQSDDFCITPILDWEKQISGASIDLRLDNQFIIITRTSLSCINPIQQRDFSSQISQFQKLVKIPYGEEFVLHPNELVIGSTLEYLSFPNDLTAYVIGRSSWGRLGLIIATATSINPCFKGTLTLELINQGNVPVVLYPGVRIAQLILHPIGEKIDERSDREKIDECSDKSKYHLQIGPGFSKIYEDQELHYLSMPKYKIALGLTGHKGSAKNIISSYLMEDKLYKYFSLSHIVRQLYKERDLNMTPSREELQDFGDRLRRENGADYLARLVVDKIQKSNIDRNTSILIGGIRNPEEIDLLNRLPNFYMIGISAEKEKIKEILSYTGYIPAAMSEVDFEKAYERDCGNQDEDGMGQNITECLRKIPPQYSIKLTETITDLLNQFKTLLKMIE